MIVIYSRPLAGDVYTNRDEPNLQTARQRLPFRFAESRVGLLRFCPSYQAISGAESAYLGDGNTEPRVSTRDCVNAPRMEQRRHAVTRKPPVTKGDIAIFEYREKVAGEELALSVRGRADAPRQQGAGGQREYADEPHNRKTATCFLRLGLGPTRMVRRRMASRSVVPSINLTAWPFHRQAAGASFSSVAATAQESPSSHESGIRRLARQMAEVDMEGSQSPMAERSAR